MASFANGGKFYTAINSPSLWRFENDIRLKQTFNDTIYTLSDSKIKPYLIFELGDWAWQYQDRLEEGGCEKKIMIDYALEKGSILKIGRLFVDYIIKLIIELC